MIDDGNVVSLTSEEFMDKVNSNIDNAWVSTLKPMYSEVARFLFNSRQNIIYRLKDRNYIKDTSLLDLFSHFGIVFGGLLGERDSVIVYLNPESYIEDLNNQLSELPTGDIPTLVVVILTDDQATILDVLTKVKESYPNAVSAQKVFDKINANSLMSKIREELKTDSLIDISDKVEELSKTKKTSFDYLELFNNIVESIHSYSMNKCIIVYPGDSSYYRDYLYIASELYLRYRERCYVDEAYVRDFCSMISSSYLDRDSHLVEEIISYYMNLPNILVNTCDYGFRYALVKGKSMSLCVSYVNMESMTLVESKKMFNIDGEINLMSLSSVFDLNTISGCCDLHDTIDSLYSILSIDDGEIIKAQNLIVFNTEDSMYLGYVHDIFVDIKSACSIDGLNVPMTINYQDLKEFLPLGVYINGPNLYARLNNIHSPREALVQSSPKLQTRRFTTILKDIPLRIGDLQDESKCSSLGLDLSTVSLFSSFGVRAETFCKKHIEPLKSLNYVRNLLDCFGGLNPALVKNIEL